MKRLIVSGCSYTQGLIPNWSFILGNEFDITYNFGCAGAGNEYIFHSLIDADSILNFSENDVIIVVWSGYYRIDVTKKDGLGKDVWNTRGDISHYPKEEYFIFHNYYPDEFLEKKSINYILSTYRYLKSKNVTFYFSSLYDLMEGNQNITRYIKPIINDDIFVFKNGIHKERQESWGGSLNNLWGHPAPCQHYNIATEFAKKLNITLSLDRKIINIHKKISEENFVNFIKKNCSQCSTPIKTNMPLKGPYQQYTKENIQECINIICESFRDQSICY